MGSGKLIINLDVLFMNDLIMTLVLLWATARFSRLKVRIWPLLASGLLGALYTIVVILPFFKGLSVPFYIVFHLVLNIVIASLMIRVAFGPLKIKKFIKTLGYFYLISFIAGGAAISLYFVVGSSPTQWIFEWIKLGNVYGWLYLLAVGVTVMVGRHGWNLIRERLYKEEYHMAFRIKFDDQVVEVKGLIDTGNLLREPMTNLPVIVVEAKVLNQVFPVEIQSILADGSLDLVDKVEMLLQTSWFYRFRVIPFSSLGQKGGLLIGCKPDRVEFLGKENRQVERVILALHLDDLDLEGDYHALLHPDLFEAAS